VFESEEIPPHRTNHVSAARVGRHHWSASSRGGGLRSITNPPGVDYQRTCPSGYTPFPLNSDRSHLQAVVGIAFASNARTGEMTLVW